MPFKLTNRQALDRRNPIELVLELLSFAGGENTIGEDQELKSNEARIIRNWDAISLGGMERSKGLRTSSRNTRCYMGQGITFHL